MGILNSMKTRQRLGKLLLKRQKDFRLLNYFKNVKINYVIRDAKNDYFKNKKVNYNNNIKKVWKTIGEIINMKCKEKVIPTQININNELIDLNSYLSAFTNAVDNHTTNIEKQIADSIKK